MSKPARLTSNVLLMVESDPCSGARNMATDEYLLEAAISDGLRVVRMYRWSEPTVSLGHFQDADDDSLRTRFQGLAAVRRLSGGGAILHHHELTYSMVLPADDLLTREPTTLYARVHRAIIEVLKEFGAECAMRGEDASQPSEPFLCFVRGDRHDIHCAGHKVVGSAQRRRKGAVLQHGSIILNRSPHANEIPGLCDLSRTFADRISTAGQVSRLQSSLGFAIGRSLGETAEAHELPEDASDRIAELEASRYSSTERKRKERRSEISARLDNTGSSN